MYHLHSRQSGRIDQVFSPLQLSPVDCAGAEAVVGASIETDSYTELEVGEVGMASCSFQAMVCGCQCADLAGFQCGGSLIDRKRTAFLGTPVMVCGRRCQLYRNPYKDHGASIHSRFLDVVAGE